MTYCNYGSDQLGNENRGVGRRSEVDEGTDKAKTPDVFGELP